MKKPKNIIIVSGNLHNVGDLALLIQNAYILRAIFPNSIPYCRQWADLHPDIKAQLDEHGVRPLNGKQVLSTLAKSRGSLVVVGGGQMLRENTSRTSLSALTVQMTFAKLTGGRTAIIGCGVGRLLAPYPRAAWRWIVRGLSFCSVRDQSSYNNLHQLAPNLPFKIRLSRDLAFYPSPLHNLFRRNEHSVRFVIIAPCNDKSEDRKINIQTLVESAIGLARQLGVRKVVVAAHDARPDMDVPVCLEVAAQLRAAADIDASVLSSFRLADYINVYKSAALVITNRLHPVIFGLLAGAPIVVLEDGGQKTRDAALYFGIPTAEINVPFDQALVGQIVAEAVRGADPKRTLNIELAKRMVAADIQDLRAALTGA